MNDQKDLGMAITQHFSNKQADRSDADQAPFASIGLALVAIVMIVSVGAGVVLWAAKGSVIFTELVDLALAWCM